MESPINLLSEKEIATIVSWCEKNPMPMYGDRGDRLPDAIAARMVGDLNLESLGEWLWECENHNSDYAMNDYLDEAARDIVDLLDIDCEASDFQETQEIIKQTILENYTVDSSDFLRVCLRNCSPHITATIVDADGDGYHFPQSLPYHNDRDTNAACLRKLRTIGIRNGWKAESFDAYDQLKIIGTIDMHWFYTELCAGRKPNGKIRIGSLGRPFAHNSFNGSGGTGDITISGTHLVDCTLQLDSKDRHGIDSVYGLTGECWRDELDLQTE
jgi:hypothetical protein